MRIRILAEASKRIERLFEYWGLSMLIDDDVLFDTFSGNAALRRGFERCGVDPEKIKHIVISHDHWDHTGGLPWILSKTKDAKVYICAHAGEDLRNRIATCGIPVIDVKAPLRIREGILSTGEIQARYKDAPLFEQSLVVLAGAAPALLTGCSHPGIVKILSAARMIAGMDFGLCAGGFHLNDKSGEEIERTLREMKAVCGVARIAPMHCTGRKAVAAIKKKKHDSVLSLKTGDAVSYNTKKNRWEKSRRYMEVSCVSRSII